LEDQLDFTKLIEDLKSDTGKETSNTITVDSEAVIDGKPFRQLTVASWSGNKNKFENSRSLGFHRWSDASEVDEAVEFLVKELRKTKTAKNLKRKKLKVNLRVLILNLFHHRWPSTETYTSYSRSKDKYRKSARYNPRGVCYPLVHVVDGLVDLGYVEQKNGFYDRRVDGRSKTARVWATQKLIGLMENKFRITRSMAAEIEGKELVHLKNSEKERIDYTDTPKTKKMRAFLVRYNEAIAKADISLEVPPDIEIASLLSEPLDTTQTITHRVFNETFDLGGRFYGPWWVGIKKGARRYIRIDGKETVECDYQGLHVHLLFSREGLTYYDHFPKGDDPYLVTGYETVSRNLRKKVFLVAFNATSKSEAVKTIRWVCIRDNDNSYKGVDLGGLVDAFAKKYDVIEKHLYKSIGKELQNLDSTIAEYIFKAMLDKGIVVLGIHDSFIVQKDHRDLLVREMKKAFDVFELSSVPLISSSSNYRDV